MKEEEKLLKAVRSFHPDADRVTNSISWVWAWFPNGIRYTYNLGGEWWKSKNDEPIERGKFYLRGEKIDILSARILNQ